MAYLLMFLSISKLYIASIFEKNKLEKDLFFSIKDDPRSFRKTVITILVIDGIIELLGGLFLLS